MSKQTSNNEFDSLDEFFSDKLRNSSIAPPERVWEGIERSLNKKRKRRFFWLFFGGLIFIGSFFSVYFFLFDNKNENNLNATTFKNKSTGIITYKKTDKQITEKQTLPIETHHVEEEKTSLVRIQLGAFKNQIDKAIFHKVRLDIKSEINHSGITRYYAEVPGNQVSQTLDQIKQAGFANAFIQRNVGAATPNILVEKEPIISKSTKSPRANSQGLKINEETELVSYPPKNQNQAINTTLKTNGFPQNNDKPVSIDKEPITNISTQQIQDSTKNKNVALHLFTDTTIVSPENPAKKDSLQKDTTEKMAAINKKDSVIVKSDSIKPVVKPDSSIKGPLLNRWALLLTGGPNFFSKNTQNNLFNIQGEKQPYTYGASLKTEYKILKNLSVSIGLNYNYFIAKQDATLFYFNKNLNSDFVFYSSYGPMAVDKNTMLQGFSMQAPVTMFHANYSYTSKISTLMIPIEAKWYYLNGKKINLFTSIGASGMFVLSEKTNLSIIKEHITNNVSYNQINTSKINAVLMLGLGGDVKLFRQIYFTADAGFRYGVNNLSHTSGIRNNLTYFSVNGGIKIKL